MKLTESNLADLNCVIEAQSEIDNLVKSQDRLLGPIVRGVIGSRDIDAIQELLGYMAHNLPHSPWRWVLNNAAIRLS